MIENLIGSMIYTFITSLREILEAALIIGIINGYLTKINRDDLKKDQQKGIILAVVASLLLASVFIIVFESLPGYKELFESLIMFIAAGVLSWMVLWMWNQSKSIKGNIETEIHESISENAKRGLVAIVFFAVFRELAELVLFLYVAYVEVSATEGPVPAIFSVSMGFGFGLLISILMAYFLFKSTTKLNLKKFFNITSIILIIFAAGILAHGIHELYEFFEVNAPNLANLVIFNEFFNLNDSPIGDILRGLFGWSYSIDYPNTFEKSSVGGILTGLLGWNDNPAIIEFGAYILYYVVIGFVYFYIKNKPNSPLTAKMTSESI